MLEAFNAYQAFQPLLRSKPQQTTIQESSHPQAQMLTTQTAAVTFGHIGKT
jgi:hypothetical protein